MSDDKWTCSCGNVNDGHKCAKCGNSAETAPTEHDEKIAREMWNAGRLVVRELKYRELSDEAWLLQIRQRALAMLTKARELLRPEFARETLEAFRKWCESGSGPYSTEEWLAARAGNGGKPAEAPKPDAQPAPHAKPFLLCSLDGLRDLRPGWDSYGGMPPTRAAIATVEGLLDAQAIPCSDGGIQIETGDVCIEIKPDGFPKLIEESKPAEAPKPDAPPVPSDGGDIDIPALDAVEHRNSHGTTGARWYGEVMVAAEVDIRANVARATAAAQARIAELESALGALMNRISTRTGAQRIADERQRQISKEGWTPEHDEQNVDGELALAAACYAAPVRIYRYGTAAAGFRLEDPWPEWWEKSWDKREPKGTTGTKRIRELEKAGALIAAEIDRLLRKSGTP